MPAEQTAAAKTRRCFVVMGFGIKTDFATGRKLDLDKSYRLLIKPVVEEKGITCVRADEIRHSGAIDVPMYQELLTADVVIADLSTANPNAIYELGVRHALRPHTTIVMAENKLSYPFDLNHIVINGYTHLGEAIDFDEVMRFRKELGLTLDAVLQNVQSDSPVYTFLRLMPPSLIEEAVEAARAAKQASPGPAGQAAGGSAAPGGPDPTLAFLVAQGEAAIKAGQLSRARELFTTVAEFGKAKDTATAAMGRDPYLIQRLALATYKAKEPDAVSALNKALAVLKPLHPDEANDPETVGLAGAIEKRLYEAGQGAEHLGFAIWYYGRGFYLRYDWYNGINLAYLLNLRTDSPLDATTEEKIADLVWANRIRREVLALCARDLRVIRAQPPEALAVTGADEAAAQQERRFWCHATKAEAHFGLGEFAQYRKTRAEAEKIAAASWMIDTFDEQIGKLGALLEKHGHLLNPPWKAEAAAPQPG
jgi:hypothetical protein